LLVASTLGGCASHATGYAITAPSFNREAWTMNYPANADKQKVKCVAENSITGAVIRYEEDPSYAPTAKDAAMYYRFRMRDADFTVSEIAQSEDERGKYASFTYTTTKGLKGKVVAVHHADVKRNIVLVGRWSAENDVRASQDIDRLAYTLEVGAFSY
jgi:hypothetical protein